MTEQQPQLQREDIYADSEKANFRYICNGEVMGFADEVDWSVGERYQKGLKFFYLSPWVSSGIIS